MHWNRNNEGTNILKLCL